MATTDSVRARQRVVTHRALFEEGEIKDHWLPMNANDGKPKEWADLKRNEQRAITSRLARNLADYRGRSKKR